jgi:hypothetical protein
MYFDNLQLLDLQLTIESLVTLGGVEGSNYN